MLLPSALPCDMRPPAPLQRPRPSSSRLFVTPPPSDDESASQASSSLFNTCQALQTLLGTQKPAIGATAPLLSPIAMKPSTTKISKKSAKAKVTLKATPAPRGIHKRRRDPTDDGRAAHTDEAHKFSTPKRMRLAPPELPLGMTRGDFEGLDSLDQDVSMEKKTAGREDWSAEDDRLLVELVLEKLRLTEKDWNECARKLGKDSGSIGMRWKELIGEGHVGLRRGRRGGRGRIDTSWR